MATEERVLCFERKLLEELGVFQGLSLEVEKYLTVVICQLSLWIKTAVRGQRLTSLDHTIRECNSIIGDPAAHPKAFDWQAALPEVFAQGGFDVVVGNPPYIRQELLSPFKLWLDAHYEVFHGMADQYRSSETGAAERVF